LSAISFSRTLQVLDAAYEHGCTHWDTSDGYGDSEELIGKWCVGFVTFASHLYERLCIRFKRTGKRNEIFLATKFAITFHPETGLGVRGDKEYVKEAFNRSLAKLGGDMIDLFYLHR
jgi:aryl-alcohol dehydrogenase-like predicted oxidoreductase